jgi:hypothetical protein
MYNPAQDGSRIRYGNPVAKELIPCASRVFPQFNWLLYEPDTSIFS